MKHADMDGGKVNERGEQKRLLEERKIMTENSVDEDISQSNDFIKFVPPSFIFFYLLNAMT